MKDIKRREEKAREIKRMCVRARAGTSSSCGVCHVVPTTEALFI